MTHGKTVLLDLIWIAPLQIALLNYTVYTWILALRLYSDLGKILHVSTLGGILYGLSCARAIATLNATLFTKTYCCYYFTFFLIVSLCSARFFIRFAKDYKRYYSDCKKVIIVGAGYAGEGLVRDLLRDNHHRYYSMFAFVDDDLKKRGREIHNVRVMGSLAELPDLIKKYDIDLVLIAIPPPLLLTCGRSLIFVKKPKSAVLPCPALKILHMVELVLMYCVIFHSKTY